MSFLAIIMLATSIHSTAAIAAPAGYANQTAQARIALNRQIATQEAAVRRNAVHEALIASHHRFSRSLQRQIAATRIRPAAVTWQLAIARDAKARLDREVARHEQTLHREAVATALADVTRNARATLVTHRKPATVAKTTVAPRVTIRRLRAK